LGWESTPTDRRNNKERTRDVYIPGEGQHEFESDGSRDPGGPVKERMHARKEWSNWGKEEEERGGRKIRGGAKASKNVP